MSWLDEVTDVVSDVSGILTQGVDAWGEIVGAGQTNEQPGTIQTNPPATAVESPDSNPTFASDFGLDNTQLMLIGGAVLLAFLLLR